MEVEDGRMEVPVMVEIEMGRQLKVPSLHPTSV
jgi:hypothetical protein